MRHLYGAALCRILLGAAGVVYVLADYGNRHLLWGPSGLFAFDRTRAGFSLYPNDFSVFAASANPAVFDGLFHACLVVFILFAVLGGRMLAVGFAIGILSLYARNPLLRDGGDNLVALVCLVFPFVVSNAHWSPVSPRVRSKVESAGGYSIAAHNAAVTIIMFQTAVVYLVAGLWKIAGPEWQHGIAMNYVFHTKQFSFDGWVQDLYDNRVVSTVSTYLTVGVQLAFVPLVVSGRRTRLLAVSLVAVMHLGIMTFLGLVGFGLNMLAADSIFLDDTTYAGKISTFRSFTARFLRSAHPGERMAAP